MSNANNALLTVEEIDALELAPDDLAAALVLAVEAWDIRSGDDALSDREADRAIYEMERCRKALSGLDGAPRVGEDRDGLVWTGTAWADAYDWAAERV